MSINPFAIPDQHVDNMDLFGDDDNVQVAHAATGTSSAANATPEYGDGLSDDEEIRRRALEYEEDENAPLPSKLPGTEQRYALQNLGMPRSSDGNCWMLRLPQFLKYETRPFHPDTFQAIPDKDPNQTNPAVDRSLSIKVELTSTIRWKWIRQDDGTMARQSNSRVIRWDDGSMSLQIGKELYDITATSEGPAIRPTESQVDSQQSQSQPLSQSTSKLSSSRPLGPAFIVSQHQREQLLQVEAPITGTMSLRPVGMNSDMHRQLVKAVAQKHMKHSKLRFASEAMLAAAEKDQEALKKKGGKSSRLSVPGDGIRRRKKVSAYERRRQSGYSDDDSAEDEPARSRMSMGMGLAGISSRRADEEMDEDFVVADSDEDFDFGEAPVRRKPKKVERERGDDEVYEKDILDEIDEKIERNLAKQRESKRDGSDADADADADADHDMDEDEEETANAIRKSSSKGRKAFITDSEEE